MWSSDGRDVGGVQHPSVERPDLEEHDALAQARFGVQVVERGSVTLREPAIALGEALQIRADHTIDVERGDPGGAVEHTRFDLVADPGAGDHDTGEHHEQAGSQILSRQRPPRRNTEPGQDGRAVPVYGSNCGGGNSHAKAILLLGARYPQGRWA